MYARSLNTLAFAVTLLAQPAVGQAGAAPARKFLGGTLQYRSPAGVEYLSQADTGPIARADSELRADPKNIDKIVALGVAQAGARQMREAIVTFTKGLEIYPNNALLLRWRGHRYLSVREFGKAYADLTKGTQLDPSIYGLWYHLGIVKFVGGDFAGAAAAFKFAQPKAPNPGELSGSTDWMWMALSRAGRGPEAQAMLDHHPDSVLVNNEYAKRLKLYRGLVSPDSIMTAADTSDVGASTLAYGVGNWYLVKGDTADARKWFERSVKSGGWPAFGFIMSEVDLKRLK